MAVIAAISVALQPASACRVTVTAVCRNIMTRGETTVRSRRGHKPSKLAQLYAAIRQHVAERRDTTIKGLRAWVLATHQVAASVGVI
jgi:hypothetical protein